MSSAIEQMGMTAGTDHDLADDGIGGFGDGDDMDEHDFGDNDDGKFIGCCYTISASVFLSTNLY